MQTGNALEHKVLDALGIPGLEHDGQKIIGRLRVNIDGLAGRTIFEAKTYRHAPPLVYKPPMSHIRQTNVEMYAFDRRRAYIIAYGVSEEEYRNWYLPIDPERLSAFLVEYDEEFIATWLPRFKCLERCLIEGVYPKEEYID